MQKALLFEAAAAPKPGLVDRFNRGAHGDMDIFSFQASAAALAPFFRRFIHAGLVCRAALETRAGEVFPPSPLVLAGLFPRLRPIGRAAEEAMLNAAGGANTHRGLIFSMGIVGAALGYWYAPLLCRGKRPEPDLALISRLCAELARPALEDFAALKDGEGTLSHGEELYLLHGLRGARGEAAGGFPAVFGCGLPSLRRFLSEGLDLDRSLAISLLHIMAETDDTACISRSSLETWRQIQADIREQLPLIRKAENLDALREMDRRFIRENLSPGGSADILALSLFFYFLEEEIFNHGLFYHGLFPYL
jgi:holo-ACP synthase/triphosphoribosyl-dephospho-CoA synthase